MPANVNPFTRQLRQVLKSRPDGELNFRLLLKYRGLLDISQEGRKKAIRRLLDTGSLPNKKRWQQVRRMLEEWGASRDEIERLEETWLRQNEDNRQPRSK